MSNKLVELGEFLFSNRHLEIHSRQGLCRVWTRFAYITTIDWIGKHNITGMEVQAREIKPEKCLWHTFLRVTYIDDTYAYDGAGVCKLKPWWGDVRGTIFENSTLDQIDLLIREQLQIK